MTEITLLPLTEVGACAPERTREPISQRDAASLAAVAKALADPTRLRLLSIIAASAGQGACVCDLTEPLDIGQPTVSHHLRVLTDAGFVTRSQRGTWAFYSLEPGSLDALSARILAL